MILKCSKPNIKRLFNRSISEDPIVFENGQAEVDADVGRAFVQVYDDLSIVDAREDYDFEEEEVIDG